MGKRIEWFNDNRRNQKWDYFRDFYITTDAPTVFSDGGIILQVSGARRPEIRSLYTEKPENKLQG